MPPSAAGRRSPALGFCLRFGGLVLVLFTLLYVPVLEKAVVAPFLSLTAAAAAGILGLLGEPVTRDAARIFSPRGGMEIAHGCDVTYEWILYAAAVVAFPVRWRSKGSGLLVGLPMIYVLNLVRVVTLFYLVTRNSEAFEWVHLYAWQTFFIAFVFGVWALWARSALRASASQLAAEAP